MIRKWSDDDDDDDKNNIRTDKGFDILKFTRQSGEQSDVV